MIGIGRADEAVVADAQRRRHVLERADLRVDIGLGCDAGGTRGLRDLEAMLVGTGQESHGFAVEAVKPRDCVGRDDLIGVAHVRAAVGVCDRCRDVEGVRRFHELARYG